MEVFARMRPYSACLIGTLLLVMTAACAPSESLAPLKAASLENANPQEITVNFCTDPAVEQKSNVKMIVILDHSGSNKENYLMAPDGTGAPALVNGAPVINTTLATDPTGHTRYGDINTPGTLLNYLHTTPPNDSKNPSRFFALIDFNSQANTYPANKSGFTSDVADFYQHVQQDAGGLPPTQTAPQDTDSTSYLSALGAAYDIINGDILRADQCAKLSIGTPSPGTWCPTPGSSVSSSYVIVFMSDGSPITDISGIGVDSNGRIVTTGPIKITKEPTNQILGQVGSILALTANSRYVSGINLFTIYYYHEGNVDRSGQTLLADMAKVGNGLAYNALSGTNIDYHQFTPPKKLVKFQLADVFVTNSSVTWWNDGKLHMDTDMDGLPDDVETAWGSNPLNSDTNGSGVSDLVRYQLSHGQACAHKNSLGICIDPAQNYASGVCSGVPRVAVPGDPGRTTFVSSDPNGLNDCEKLLLSDGGGIGNPDSNSDLIPDWLEFKNGVPFQLGSAAAVNQPELDGLSIYEKIKTSLPANLPLYQILNPTPANYHLINVSTSASRDCYRLAVTDIPTLSSSDLIRVDIILKSQLLQDRYLYRTAERRLAHGTKAFEMNDWNDPQEKILGEWKVSQ